MLIGHHGVFSLSPIFLFSILGAFLALRGRYQGAGDDLGPDLVLTVAMVAFYDWNPKARNYGGPPRACAGCSGSSRSG